jgi:polysaccharide chain length determinant protein (PEP-CTERM system associated)
MENLYSEIQKYLKMINKGKFFFISLSFLIMSIIVWGNYFMQKIYEASSTVFIERGVINELVKGIAITPSMDDRIKVIRYEMFSRGILEKVMKDLDLDSKLNDKRMLNNVINHFQKKTKLEVKGEELFIVSIQDPDPKLARDYINGLIRRYVEDNISAKREETFAATRFLSEQLANLKEKLDKSENAIISFRQQQGIYLSVDEKSLIEEMKRYKLDMEGLKIKKDELVATIKSIKGQLQSEKPFTVAILSKGKIDNNRVLLENRLNQLLVKYTENYPEVIMLKEEIEALKKQGSNGIRGDSDSTQTESEMSTLNPIYQELKQKVLHAGAELSALYAKEKQLTAMIEEREKELRHLPEGKKRLSELEKERDTYRNLHEQLLIRHGQSEVSKQMEIEDKSTTFRIVDPAVLPQKPVSPNRPMMIIAGIILGFLGGFGGVYLREYLDPSVKEPQVLKDLGLVVLAVIPRIFNADENRRRVKKERLLYTVSAIYLFVIGINLLMEVMGVSPVEPMLAKIGLKELIKNTINMLKDFKMGFK